MWQTYYAMPAVIQEILKCHASICRMASSLTCLGDIFQPLNLFIFTESHIMVTCQVVIEFSVLSSCWDSNCRPWNRHPVMNWGFSISINCALSTQRCTNQHMWYLCSILDLISWHHSVLCKLDDQKITIKEWGHYIIQSPPSPWIPWLGWLRFGMFHHPAWEQ